MLEKTGTINQMRQMLIMSQSSHVDWLTGAALEAMQRTYGLSYFSLALSYLFLFFCANTNILRESSLRAHIK